MRSARLYEVLFVPDWIFFHFFLKMGKKHLDLSDYHAICSSPVIDPAMHDAHVVQLEYCLFCSI